MTRLAFLIFLLTFLFCSCSDKPKIANGALLFKSFEISYSAGWTKGFSLFVDSNKIYFSPEEFDKIYYGILPDTIFKLLDVAFLKILNEKTIKSKDDGCQDCPTLAIQIISNNDTIKIHQTGAFSNILDSAINTLQKFIDGTKHASIPGFVWLGTKSIVRKLPPKN